jgi:hypothetical protein
MVLQKFPWTYQTLLDKVNEDIYRPMWYVEIFIISKFLGFGKGDLRATILMRWWQEELLLQQI